MVLHADDIIEEWEVGTFLDFINTLKIDKKLLLKKFKDVDDVDDIYDSKYFRSDEDEIKDLLDEMPDTYTMMFIDDRHDGYFVIRKIKNKQIEIPFSECDVQEMQDEDWDRDWTFDGVDVHLFRQEEGEDEGDENA
jgi:hypothetical protein